MIRVYLADDHSVIRAGVKMALSNTSDIEVVGEADNGLKVLEVSRDAEWDVLLLDLQLPEKSGFEVLRRLRVRNPSLRILILSIHTEALYALQAMKMGAAGYITKQSGLDVFAKAIRKVYAGDNYVSEDIVSELVAMTTSGHSPGGDLHELLSEREMQIFLMIAGGQRLTDIGEELNISVKTVSTHRRHILDKMNVKGNSDIVRYAIKAGLLV